MRGSEELKLVRSELLEIGWRWFIPNCSWKAPLGGPPLNGNESRRPGMNIFPLFTRLSIARSISDQYISFVSPNSRAPDGVDGRRGHVSAFSGIKYASSENFFCFPRHHLRLSRKSVKNVPSICVANALDSSRGTAEEAPVAMSIGDPSIPIHRH